MTRRESTPADVNVSFRGLRYNPSWMRDLSSRVLPAGAFLVVVALLLGAADASAATRSKRPARTSPAPAGTKDPRFAPDRILVKFHESVAQTLSRSIPVGFGAGAPGVETGIASVDALGRTVGVQKITRPFIEPTNEAEATRVGLDRWYTLHVAPGTDIEEAVRQYGADPNVERAVPNLRALLADAPNDPMYPDNWGHHNTAQLPSCNQGDCLAQDWGYVHNGSHVGTTGFDTNAEAGWDEIGYGSPSVIIGIVDTGIDVEDDDLTRVPGWNFVDGSDDTDDPESGHGTRCALVAAAKANNGIAGCGAAPGCVVMPLKVVDEWGDSYLDAVAAAVVYAADHGVAIACISMEFPIVGLGGLLDDAIVYAHAAGVTIVAAAGNGNRDILAYPANHSLVIAVGAAAPCGGRKRSSRYPEPLCPDAIPDPHGCTCDGEAGWGSSYGANVPDAADAVDVIAPTMLPAYIWRDYQDPDEDPLNRYFNGTSASAAYTAGVCALIKSVCPSYTPDQVRDRLVSTAQDIVNVESGVGWDRYTGYGMVDIQAACHVADVWLDYNHADGTYLGTYLHPCGSMFQALTNVPAGGTLAIKPGQSHEPSTWPRSITQPMKIIAPLGPAVTGY